MNIVVQRTAGDANTPIQGVWSMPSFRCLTLEHPTKFIAAGTYPLTWTQSPRFSKAATAKARKKDPKAAEVKVYTPEIIEVKGRAGLRVHVANYTRELEGCIAPGFSFKDIDKDGTIDIAQCTAAYDQLCEALLSAGIKNKVFKITIIDAFKLKF